MSELPTVTGKQAIAAFERHGFSVVRITGSHHIMKRPGNILSLSVPVHGKKPLKRGTLRGLISASGLTVEQFADSVE